MAPASAGPWPGHVHEIGTFAGASTRCDTQTASAFRCAAPSGTPCPRAPALARAVLAASAFLSANCRDPWSSPPFAPRPRGGAGSGSVRHGSPRSLTPPRPAPVAVRRSNDHARAEALGALGYRAARPCRFEWPLASLRLRAALHDDREAGHAYLELATAERIPFKQARARLVLRSLEVDPRGHLTGRTGPSTRSAQTHGADARRPR
jgi:hypothetical protein